MSPYNRLQSLNIILPEVTPPVAAFGVAQIPSGASVEIDLIAEVL